MQTIYKPYDETTADDFRRLFVARFPTGDARILDVFLSNPSRRIKRESGKIAYDEDGSVKAILGLPPRRVYMSGTPLMAINGVALAVRKDANRDFFTAFLGDSVRASGADVYFVNTAIPPSRKRTATALEVKDGPESCAVIRERDLSAGRGGLARLVQRAFRKFGIGRRTLPNAPGIVVAGEITVSRELQIEMSAFDGFWSRYLSGQDGLVTSRTAEDLRWVFDAGLKDGDVVLMTATRGCELVGYAFLRRTDETSVCWRIADMIALRDDEKVLTALIEASATFLRRHTPATCLQVTGFPMWVQPLLKRLFPKQSLFGFNKCIWAYLNEKTAALCGDWIHAQGGWYGCPYDGDMCLV